MLSVLIITKNEERLIKNCLESVKWADEIIIADSGSVDRTIEIAKNYTKKILKCKGNDYSSWRNEALKIINGDYLLCVDADERVTKDLREEIISLIQKEPEKERAWAIPRKNIILGELKMYGPFWPDYVIRLFKTSNLKKWEGEIHEQPVFDGELGKLKNPFVHLTHRDIDSMVMKTLRYESFTAKYRYQAGHPKMSSWRFFRILFTGLWQQGIVNRGFFSGTVGVIDSLLQVFSLYISYVKLWELQLPKKLPELYDEIDSKLLKDDFQIKQ